ncbi:MAG: hypothetical protein KC415_10130 [Anaerolineales bacterium]|nr:hypothetical protein [Anaerolineales bacterium]MCB9005525.1 hypothetical protein [Ardenticatenaceae bacterium]
MNDILLLDESLRVRIYYDCDDCEFDDNICVSLVEECPDEEKILIADETNIYLTPEQAKAVAQALIAAVNEGMGLGNQ